MLGERQTRTLLGPADPARSVPVPPAGASATELIQRAAAVPAPADRPAAAATASPGHRVRPAHRRLLVAAATAIIAVAAVAAYPLLQPAQEQPAQVPLGGVVVPIAYEVTTDPPPAGDHLRDLAGQLTDAPYESSSGEYLHHFTRSWGATSQESPEGHRMDYVEEREIWIATDGSVRHRLAVVGIEFADEASRRFFQGLPNSDLLLAPPDRVMDVPADWAAPGGPLPSDRDQLAERFRRAEIADAVFTRGRLLDEHRWLMAVAKAYETQAIPSQVRALILEFLADEPGVVWRGEVTDRLGRDGVAVSFDSDDVRTVMVFDPGTGELLAQELVDLQAEPTVILYSAFDTDHTDERPEPTGPDPERPAMPVTPGVSPSPGYDSEE